ncbi:winged helix-turn-helix domain-containing protein [Micromonospora sp. NPDC047707]|uniref:winged helix-turn-helix domain-containing protein n=1 Tax=Micromonospora sp. NPDC047707 TaxID=3154498 RepID=UPI00345282B0
MIHLPVSIRRGPGSAPPGPGPTGRPAGGVVRVELTAREFEILVVLARAAGRVHSRRQIIDVAYGADRYVSDRAVDAHMVNLRRKLDAVTPGRPYLRTVHGRGYLLAEPP